MTIEYITDKNPQYIYNKHTTYENTVLQEHASIVSGLKDVAAVEALIEAQGRLFIGLCMKDKTITFIENNLTNYYNNEYNKLASTQLKDSEKKSNAYNRAWLRLINEAAAFFINKYKVDGSKAKIAIVDDVTTDGRKIKDADDLPKDSNDSDKIEDPDHDDIQVDFSDD